MATDRCDYHEEMSETVKVLTDLNNSTLQWQASEEAHRANLYKVLTEMQVFQAKMFDKLGNIEVNMHKEFATKGELKDAQEEIRSVDQKLDKQVWKMIGIVSTVTLALVGLMQWIATNM